MAIDHSVKKTKLWIDTMAEETLAVAALGETEFE